MNWLIVLIVYYVLIYVGLGGLLVQVLELLTWEHMTGMLVGVVAGHFLGQSCRMPGK